FVVIIRIRVKAADPDSSSGMDKGIVADPHADVNHPLPGVRCSGNAKKQEVTYLQILPILIAIHFFSFQDLLGSVSRNDLSIEKKDGFGETAAIRSFDRGAAPQVGAAHHAFGRGNKIGS